MDIITGTMEIHIEKTAAMILAVIPLIAVVQLPQVIKGIQKLVLLFRKRKMVDSLQQRVLMVEKGYKQKN